MTVTGRKIKPQNSSGPLLFCLFGVCIFTKGCPAKQLAEEKNVECDLLENLCVFQVKFASLPCIVSR